MLVDESPLYLLPGVVSSYAPKGETPVLRSLLSRDHLSLMEAVTPDGRIYGKALTHSVMCEDAVDLLRHLVRQLGKILVIWDGLPAHRSRLVTRYLVDEAKGCVWLERLLGYAPDLNPTEGIWKHLKLTELVNVCCRNIKELKSAYRLAKERLRHKTHVIRACFGMAGLA